MQVLNQLYLSVPSQFLDQLKSRSPDRDSAFLWRFRRAGPLRTVTAPARVSSVDEPVPVQSRSESLTWGDLHVTESGDAAGQPVLFLHGTPGSAGFFTRYLVHARLQHLRLLAIDRPGWGNSILRENFDATLATQSETVGEFLCSLVSPEFRPVVVALRIAWLRFCCLQVLDPLLAGPRWYNWLTEFSPVSWVVALSGTGLKQSNDEMMRVRAARGGSGHLDAN